MNHPPVKSDGFITIENDAAIAYRQYLKDGTVDYHIAVKQELDEACRTLTQKAQATARERLARKDFSDCVVPPFMTPNSRPRSRFNFSLRRLFAR